MVDACGGIKVNNQQEIQKKEVEKKKSDEVKQNLFAVNDKLAGGEKVQQKCASCHGCGGCSKDAQKKLDTQKETLNKAIGANDPIQKQQMKRLLEKMGLDTSALDN